jgi:hypothetical protein
MTAFRRATAVALGASLLTALVALCACPIADRGHDCCAADGPTLVAASCCEPPHRTPNTASLSATAHLAPDGFVATLVVAAPVPRGVARVLSRPVLSPLTVLRI